MDERRGDRIGVSGWRYGRGLRAGESLTDIELLPGLSASGQWGLAPGFHDDRWFSGAAAWQRLHSKSSPGGHGHQEGA